MDDEHHFIADWKFNWGLFSTKHMQDVIFKDRYMICHIAIGHSDFSYSTDKRKLGHHLLYLSSIQL